MQSCGCDLVESTTGGKRNTTICLNTKGEYEAVPTRNMCLNESSICLNSDRTAALKSTSFCSDPKSIFKCSNGKIIPKSLQCNYVDDCGTFSDEADGDFFSKQPLFEDEVSCSNQEYGVRCKLRDERVKVWVPPLYQKCQGSGICQNNEDVGGNFDCTERFKCERYGSNRTVYQGNMCDPTLKENRYCDERALTFMNCSIDWKMESTDNLTCLYQGYNSSLDRSLECDGEITCDNQEDEMCFYSTNQKGTESCIKNIFRNNEDHCLSRNKKFIACPNSTLYYINSRLVCNGEDDCHHGKSEEGKCPKGSTYKSVYQNDTTFKDSSIALYFEPQCTPGLAKSENEAQCRKNVYFYHSDLNDIHKELCHGSESQKLVCSVQYDGEISITILQKNDSEIWGLKKCDDSETNFVKITDWCDTKCDCKECADERNCTETNPRTFQCANESSVYIPYAQVCDGYSNCENSTDECNDLCPDDHTRNILTSMYRPVAGLIGSAAFLINAASLLAHCRELAKISTTNGFINLLLVTLIALGDFMIGLYMLLVLAITLHFGDSYCPEKNEWLSSEYCSGLGILSTAGTMTAMLSMTVLSVFRVYSLKMMVSFGEASRRVKLKVSGMIILGIFMPSFAIAIMPSLDIFSAYFVNGLVFEKNPFFTDMVDRDAIREVTEYFNSTIELNESGPWEAYDTAFRNLYYQEGDMSGLSNFTKRIGFYGNQGVCLFKYFVTPDDPQVAFSMSLIGLSSVCFVIISLCYIFIFKYATSTSSASGSQESQKRSLRRLQNKVTLIIITDFLTWIPFITIALLHYHGKFDATQFYEFCSILLIPINSVINPIIYNGDKFFLLVKRYFLQGRSRVSSSQRMSQTVKISSISQVTPDHIKLSSIRTKTK